MSAAPQRNIDIFMTASAFRARWQARYSIPSFAFTRSLTACGLALPPVDFIT
jgi:hypothetical protein